MQHPVEIDTDYVSFPDACKALRPGDTLPVMYVDTDPSGITKLSADHVSRDFMLYTLFANERARANAHAARSGWGIRVRHPIMGWMFVPTHKSEAE